MDYSESYQCAFQNESQNAFFHKNTVTVHLMMLYYKTHVGDDEGTLVKHAVIGITATEFTDGCASQYIKRNSFADISLSHINIVSNFFETSHGKSVCDGLGSTVKNCAIKADISGKEVIPDAKSLYNVCVKKLAHPANQEC